MCSSSKGEPITAKAHNGLISIQGITVAHVDEQVRVKKLETWFDPLEMFRQIAPNGIVDKKTVDTDLGDELLSHAQSEGSQQE